MPKRLGNLIEQVADQGNLLAAYERTARGRRRTRGHLEFREHLHVNLRRMREAMLDGSWKQDAPREFLVYEPRRREIAALPFADRVAQHALVGVIEPLFERGMLPWSFACRRGKGTHAGVRYVQSQLRATRATHFLKTDWRSYFASIDRARLHGLIERRIKCRRALSLIESMVPSTGIGLRIGWLTSQLFANVYGSVMDHFVHHELGARPWARYMDDIVVLSRNPYELRSHFEQMREFGAKRLGLEFSRWHLSPVSAGINFLGYRIWPRHKLLRKSSVTRARRAIVSCLRAGDVERLQRFLASWRGHASHADVCNLFNQMEAQYGIALHHQ